MRARKENETGSELALHDALQRFPFFCVATELAIVQKRDSGVALNEKRALLVEEQRIGFAERPPAVIEQRISLERHDEGRIHEPHVDALRSVLEEPAAPRVRLVVAADEFPQRRVADPLERLSRARAPDQPVAAAVKREPAVDRRNIRPLGDAAGGTLRP